MRYLYLLLSFSIVSSALAKEKVEIKEVEEKAFTSQESEYQILKNESKIEQLYSEIEDLKMQIEKLDLIQADIINKLNSIISAKSNLQADVRPENSQEYQYAYDMLLAGDYDRAEKAFTLYIDKYPGDEKIGEAYYWLGEIFYQKKDYGLASANYLISYRDYPKSPKKNESLFKMSVVLGLIGKKQEACGGFDLLINDNNSTSLELRDRAKRELVNFGCRN